jgi:hypothetical protein
MSKFRLGLLVALVLGLVAGCAKNPQAPAKVSGSVTYKGNPVTAGNVTFHSQDKGSYNTSLSPDGTYKITDVPKGELVVTVETESANPDKKTPDYGRGKGSKMYAERMAKEKAMGSPMGQPAGKYLKIPAKYATPKDSPLKVTLEAGKQVKDFELTD